MRNTGVPPRRSLFDSLPVDPEKNLYCQRNALTNEASVEQFFVARLLRDLGYKDSQIKPKHSISDLTVSLGGARTVRYKPDYVLTLKRKPRWVIDAKSPQERLERWIPQCSGYCLVLNQSFEDENPVSHFMLTNALSTQVYRWDSATPLLELTFPDFHIGNPRYEQLRALLAVEHLSAGRHTPTHTFRFERPSPQVTKSLFASCHRAIWKGEGNSPTAAFLEFTKIMFVKLWCDRTLREDPTIRAQLEQQNKVKLPRDAITFSTHWIDNQKVVANPVNDILFTRLRHDIEADIAKKKKKRLFGRDENIDVRPDTMRAVVDKLQHFDMFGIDEDLNGRLFEAFLNATMRGRELGQYFTPRSIVKTMTRLADLKVFPEVEKVLDGCCGTGGFLIEALTEMRNAARANASLSYKRKEELINKISNESIYGIDFGKSPPIARIARINMYLHGDGGSRIYYADALDKQLAAIPGREIEQSQDQEELRQAIRSGLRFNCALTNPPFSMTKELRNESEKRILTQYDLARLPGTARYHASLRSNVMFMERYRDLLEDGGRLLTVIDDGMLTLEDFSFVRDFIRGEFIIRAIISLPGDAFQRSGARAKTSILYLVKREQGDTDQPDVFVYECRYLGLDDVAIKTPPSVADHAREAAIQEMNDVIASFRSYLNGERGPWLVDAERLKDRLDAKFLRPWKATELARTWEKAGAFSDVLENLVDPIWTPVNLEPYREYAFLRINYSGQAENGGVRLGKEVTYVEVARAQLGDIVVSHINAVNRAICQLPKWAEGLLISKEYTVLRPKRGAKVDPAYLWAVLRSAAVVAEWLSGSTGVGRHRVDWELLRTQRVPLLALAQQKEIGNHFREIEELRGKIDQLHSQAIAGLAPLELEGEVAVDRLARAKPPR